MEVSVTVDVDVELGINGLVVVVAADVVVGTEFCCEEESRVRLVDRFRFFMAPILTRSYFLPLWVKISRQE